MEIVGQSRETKMAGDWLRRRSMRNEARARLLLRSTFLRSSLPRDTLHVEPLYTRRARETTKGKEKEGKRGALVEELAFRLGRIRYPCVYNTIEGGGDR